MFYDPRSRHEPEPEPESLLGLLAFGLLLSVLMLLALEAVGMLATVLFTGGLWVGPLTRLVGDVLWWAAWLAGYAVGTVRSL